MFPLLDEQTEERKKKKKHACAHRLLRKGEYQKEKEGRGRITSLAQKKLLSLRMRKTSMG